MEDIEGGIEKQLKMFNDLEIIDDRLATQEKKVNQMQLSITSNKSEIDSFVKECETKLQDYKATKEAEMIEQVGKWQSEIDSKKEELDKQLLRATSRNLFEKFDTEQAKLRITSGWLLFGLILSTISVVVLTIIYTNQTIEGQRDIYSLILKGLSTLPLLGLEFFLIREYSVVRSLRENYRFKSSVALSLKSFYEILSDKDKADTTEKAIVEAESTKFLTDAIRKIFTSPEEERSKMQRYRIKETLKISKEEYGLIEKFLNTIRNETHY